MRERSARSISIAQQRLKLPPPPIRGRMDGKAANARLRFHPALRPLSRAASGTSQQAMKKTTTGERHRDSGPRLITHLDLFGKKLRGSFQKMINEFHALGPTEFDCRDEDRVIEKIPWNPA